VLVPMKFNTCPGVTQKYSGTLAGISAAELLAETPAVLSMVAQSASVLAIRACLVWLPKYVVNCVAFVCAVCGQAAALMNSRRLMQPPKNKGIVLEKLCERKGHLGPLWVKNRHLHCNRPCPLYPRCSTNRVRCQLSSKRKR
jgi:hypothetical protein